MDTKGRKENIWKGSKYCFPRVSSTLPKVSWKGRNRTGWEGQRRGKARSEVTRKGKKGNRGRKG
eukprot:10196168-Prorocentrum_lima.AAC.1